ncbi:hypothetical protein D3C81_1122200 [compost metagenome]
MKLAAGKLLFVHGILPLLQSIRCNINLHCAGLNLQCVIAEQFACIDRQFNIFHRRTDCNNYCSVLRRLGQIAGRNNCFARISWFRSRWRYTRSRSRVRAVIRWLSYWNISDQSIIFRFYQVVVSLGQLISICIRSQALGFCISGVRFQGCNRACCVLVIINKSVDASQKRLKLIPLWSGSLVYS